MTRIPLICPRCGRAQRVVPGGPERPARVVHEDTGQEACEPAGRQEDRQPVRPSPSG
ncbi:hypothetical protein [Kitasatospora kazusensis]|uniref:hypothetical protein n=1 Tax=Kitasatospora kazusensis TaxID=407974 RepID=UPI0031D51764